MTLATPLASTSDRRRSPLRWVSRQTPSTGWAWTADKTKALLDSMPVAYAVTYMFGTIGSAMVIALLGPMVTPASISSPRARITRRSRGGTKEMGGAGSGLASVGAARVQGEAGGKAVGLRVAEAEALVPDARLFVLRIRRDGTIEEATADTVLKENDVVAVAGERKCW